MCIRDRIITIAAIVEIVNITVAFDNQYFHPDSASFAPSKTGYISVNANPAT